MLSGSASAEALVPGSVSAISTALENLGAGIQPVRDVGQAWQALQIPSWQGKGAAGWASVTPREASRIGVAPAAFARAAAALLRYESAFQVARAEAQAAINDAAVAEQATAQAKLDHQRALREAALADPGTPAATQPVYSDPGATALANAQTRLATAQTTLRTVGDEAASEIYAAAGSTSGVAPNFLAGGRGVSIPTNPDMKRLAEYVKGFALQAWETIAFFLQISILPGQIKSLVEDFDWMLEGPAGWARHDAELRSMWADGTILKAFANTFLAWDKWKENPAEAAGRVTFEIATLAFAIPKLGSAAKAAGAARAKVPTVDDFLPGLPHTAPPQLGRGSTGRVKPENLAEQLAMTEARTNPRAGKELSLRIGDPRWPADEGWTKMRSNINGIEIHYLFNRETGAVDDFKFKP